MENRSPSTSGVPLLAKARYAVELARYHRRDARLSDEDAIIDADIDEYDALLRQHTQTSLDSARVFEIGFGTRPFRLLAMRARGVDATGVDMEVPLLRGAPRDVAAMVRHNGVERAAKSIARGALFDRRRWKDFETHLRAQGRTLTIERDRLIVSDAALLDVEPGSVDLITSEDVFEHIGPSSLERLLPKLATWLQPDGLALIRPNCWAGITGGHSLDWTTENSDQDRPRRTAPWAHLTDPDYAVNTQLNRLTRQDFRDLFGRYFDIVGESVRFPRLGERHMTPELRRRLAEWPDDELFSNQVLFVLRPLTA